MNHVAIDADIFFYSVSTDKKDRKSQLATGLLDHIDNHPTLELCVPFSVLAESVFKSLTREKEGSDPHKMETIASLIELTHLGYALAYNMNYLITTDKILLHYQVPDGFQLKIVSLKDARETIGLR